MSIFSDFEKLHITTKSAVLSLAALVPFWFVSIYLFNKPLYNRGDLYIIGALCFCFSITYYALNILLSSLTLYIVDEQDEEPIGILILGGIVSILYLCVSMLICYWMEWGFKTFIAVAYLYLIVRTIITGIIALLKPNDPKPLESNPTVQG